MARDPKIEARLKRWAEWITVGDGSGYPSTNTLHSAWSPARSSGARPAMKVASASDAWETHAAIGRLSLRLRNTLVVHYAMRLPSEEQLARLECSADALGERIRVAHRQLSTMLRE